MKLLLDTHFLIWAANEPEHLTAQVLNLIEDEDNSLYFSTCAIWEVAIKNGRGKPDFKINPWHFRNMLINNNFIELPVTSDHALVIATLPLIHKDPFDRMLVAQATHEGITLLTADATLARYPGPIMLA